MGDAVGLVDGETVGDVVGGLLGDFVGDNDGLVVGETVGYVVGDAVGNWVGTGVGCYETLRLDKRKNPIHSTMVQGAIDLLPGLVMTLGLVLATGH